MMADGGRMTLDDLDADEIPAVDLDGLKAETARLSGLDDAAYELERETVAKRWGRYGVRVSYFDKARAKERAKSAGEEDAAGEEAVEELEPWPDPVDGASLAEEIRDRLLAHVVFENRSDADALAVWTLAAYALDQWALFPKVLITAPERECGKTTLLNVLGTVTPRALSASNATPAAIFRGIELWKPTLLLDETDTWARENPELRGVINAGHERDQAFVLRCVGDDHMPRRFSVWCPMVLSGIGKPADTILSRSLVVSLRRRLPEEHVERRPVDLRARMLRARRQALRWFDDNRIRLGASEAEPPEIGDDRRRDNFTPLWRVAQALGGEWPARIEAAYLARAETDEAEESAGVMLLRDLMALFERDGRDRMTSEGIVSDLTADPEKPWGEWRHGKPMTARTLGKLLGPFGVKAQNSKIGGQVRKAIHRDAVADAFNRYCAPALSNPLLRYRHENIEENADPIRYPEDRGSGCERIKTHTEQGGSGVADTSEGRGTYADPLDDPHNPEAW